MREPEFTAPLSAAAEAHRLKLLRPDLKRRKGKKGKNAKGDFHEDPLHEEKKKKEQQKPVLAIKIKSVRSLSSVTLHHQN